MKVTTIEVELEGFSDIMFDKFYAPEKDTRPPEQKLYLTGNNEVIFPSENIHSFLLSEKGGCAKTFEGRQGKEFIRIGQSHIIIKPSLIPFVRNGQPVVFNNFDDGTFYISSLSPTTFLKGQAIKQPRKQRPVLTLPWELHFQIDLIENERISSTRLFNWFDQGAILIGLGTYRPRYGRFRVKKFE